MKISTLFSRSFLFTGVLLFAALVSNAAAAPRDISLLPVSGAAGSKVLVPIQFTAQGDETNTAFSVHFDASVLSMSGVSGINSNPDVMKGPGATANQKIGVNALNVSNGNVGLLIDFTGGLSPVVPISAGAQQILYLRFTIRTDAPAGMVSPVTFTSAPIEQNTVDMNGITVPVNAYNPGSVTVGQGAGAAKVSISGRVVTPAGAGLRGVTVTLTGVGGSVTVATSSAGFYQFDSVDAGASYILGASSKRFRFASKQLQVVESLSGVDFTAQD